jgi:hypothetical protein
MGVLLPDGWTVTDSIPYTVVGYSAQDSTVFETGSVFVHRDTTSETLEDSEGSDAETYWWGAASIEDVQMDNLDSLYYTLTIQTDDKTGTFNLKYAIGYSDTPTDTVSGQYPITITTSSSVNKILKKEISIYPNPVSGYIYISYGDILDGELILSDVSGRTLLRKRITSSNESIDVTTFKPGIYYVTVYADGGKWSDKIIVR